MDSYVVTNLNPTGPGSLHAAVSVGGRHVTFAVGGTINLTFGNDYDPLPSDLFIDGFSAPFPGITLNAKNLGPTAIFRATGQSNITFSHLRMSLGKTAGDDSLRSGIRLVDCSDIKILNCTIRWHEDDGVASSRSTNVVVADCMIYEAISGAESPFDYNGGKGILFAGAGTRNIGIYRNLFAKNAVRNPRVSNGQQIWVVNNLIYNTTWEGTAIFPTLEDLRIDIIGNLYLHGPQTGLDKGRYTTNPNVDKHWYEISTEQHLAAPAGVVSTFVHGNLGPRRLGYWQDEYSLWSPFLSVAQAGQRHTRRSRRMSHGIYNEIPASSVYDEVLASCGPRFRDAHDLRVLEEVRTRTGVYHDPEPT